MAAMPRVAVQNAGFRTSPRTVARSGVSRSESNCPRLGSGINIIIKASKNPGAPAM